MENLVEINFTECSENYWLPNAPQGQNECR